jgi:hypothetical protein
LLPKLNLADGERYWRKRKLDISMSAIALLPVTDARSLSSVSTLLNSYMRNCIGMRSSYFSCRWLAVVTKLLAACGLRLADLRKMLPQ